MAFTWLREVIMLLGYKSNISDDAEMVFSHFNLLTKFFVATKERKVPGIDLV